MIQSCFIVSRTCKMYKTYMPAFSRVYQINKHTFICVCINTHLLVPVAFRIYQMYNHNFYLHKHTFTCNHQNLSFWTGRELPEHFLTHMSPQTPRCIVWNQTAQVTYKNTLQIRFDLSYLREKIFLWDKYLHGLNNLHTNLLIEIFLHVQFYINNWHFNFQHL